MCDCNIPPDEVSSDFLPSTSCPRPVFITELEKQMLFSPLLPILLFCSPHPTSEYNPLDLSILNFILLSLYPLNPSTLIFAYNIAPFVWRFRLILSASCLWMISLPLLTFPVNNPGMWRVLWIKKDLLFSGALSASVWLLQHLPLSFFLSYSSRCQCPFSTPPFLRSLNMLLKNLPAMSFSVLQFLSTSPSVSALHQPSPVLSRRELTFATCVWKEKSRQSKISSVNATVQKHKRWMSTYSDKLIQRNQNTSKQFVLVLWTLTVKSLAFLIGKQQAFSINPLPLGFSLFYFESVFVWFHALLDLLARPWCSLPGSCLFISLFLIYN